MKNTVSQLEDELLIQELLREQLDECVLTVSAKEAIYERISTKSYQGFSFNLKDLWKGAKRASFSVAFTFVIMAFGFTTVYSYQSSNVNENSALYFVKKSIESVEYMFTLSSESKIHKLIKFNRRRFDEIEILKDENDAVFVTVDSMYENLNDADELLKEIDDEDLKNDLEVLIQENSKLIPDFDEGGAEYEEDVYESGEYYYDSYENDDGRDWKNEEAYEGANVDGYESDVNDGVDYNFVGYEGDVNDGGNVYESAVDEGGNYNSGEYEGDVNRGGNVYESDVDDGVDYNSGGYESDVNDGGNAYESDVDDGGGYNSGGYESDVNDDGNAYESDVDDGGDYNSGGYESDVNDGGNAYESDVDEGGDYNFDGGGSSYCVDACSAGVYECGAGKFQTCADFNEDGCFEMGVCKVLTTVDTDEYEWDL